MRPLITSKICKRVSEIDTSTHYFFAGKGREQRLKLKKDKPIQS
jgi:hypothetical protein